MNQFKINSTEIIENIPDLKTGDAKNAQRVRSGYEIVRISSNSSIFSSYLANPERRCKVIE